MTQRVIAGIVLAWYLYESVRWLIAALRPPNHEVPLVYLVPRLVGTSLGLAATYLLGLPWPQMILLTFLVTVLLEGLFRLGLRILAPALVERARLYLEPAGGDRAARLGAARAALAALTALLLIGVAPLTLYTYVARETLLDARTWTDNLYGSGLYSALVRLASSEARNAARQQRGQARQVEALLSEEDVRLAEKWALPEPWTETWLQESLDATLGWMQTPSSQRVPPISIPIADIERHAKDAASLLLDQHLAAQPLCAPDTPSTAYCRPSDMSVDAYRATYKPNDMAIADEILEQIPPELDLSTAVALFGKPFKAPLDALHRVRAAVQELNRGWTLAGILCLLLTALLWLLCSVTRKSRLLWIGVTLLVTALATWAASYAARHLLPQRLTLLDSALLNSVRLDDAALGLSVPLQGFVRAMLAAVHTRISIGALVLGGLGLLLLWTPLLAPHKEMWTRRTPLLQTMRAGVILLAAVSVLGLLYAQVGARLYDQARRLYRDGSVAEAHALYRQIDRFYPFPSLASLGHAGENWIEDARQDLRECQLFLDAETAYQGAEWQAAVAHYEALWLTSPPLALRDTAQAHQVEALVRWARALEAEGQPERALDRYRFVRDENLGRGRQVDGQPIQVHRAIGDLYLDWGDELLALDPEAALATYRRALADTDDPGVWARAEERMVDAYCAWNAQLRQAGQDDRAAGVCMELGNEFPALVPNPCAACAP